MTASGGDGDDLAATVGHTSTWRSFRGECRRGSSQPDYAGVVLDLGRRGSMKGKGETD